jgi:hypothetical protein
MVRDARPRELNSGVTNAATEVDFALVLSRMIDAIQADPEQLRSTVYALARHKLDEQALGENSEERDRLSKALEVAIQGVETHFTGMALPALGPPTAQLPRLEAPTREATMVAGHLAARDSEPASKRWKPVDLDPARRLPSGRRRFGTAARYLVVLAVAAIVAVAVQQRLNPLALLRSKSAPGINLASSTPTPAQVVADRSAPIPPEPPPDPLIPTSYGAYAISDGKLYTLQLLPGRAPNPRVAISAPIPTPSKTQLPAAPTKFIVFRRDSATNALDHAEVRIIAKIVSAMSFDANGKPVISKGEDSWAIRNISLPYQTAPVRGHPDMYEILTGEGEKPLTPGRYGLILKDEVYDFTIAGQITDSRNCLESVAAVNGSFYSECRKP